MKFKLIRASIGLTFVLTLSSCEKTTKPNDLEMASFVNLGIVEPEKTSHYSLRVRNTTSIPISIEKVTPSCSCTSITFPHEPILPGSTSEINLIIKVPKGSGAGAASIVLQTKNYKRSYQTHFNYWIKPQCGFVVFPEYLSFNFEKNSQDNLTKVVLLEGPRAEVDSLVVSSEPSIIEIKSSKMESSNDSQIARRKFSVTAKQTTSPIYGKLIVRSQTNKLRIPFGIEPHVNRPDFPENIFLGRIENGSDVSNEIVVTFNQTPDITAKFDNKDVLTSVDVKFLEGSSYRVKISLHIPPNLSGLLSGHLTYNAGKSDSGETAILAFIN
jgi:hypothetical protein